MASGLARKCGGMCSAMEQSDISGINVVDVVEQVHHDLEHGPAQLRAVRRLAAEQAEALLLQRFFLLFPFQLLAEVPG